MGLDLIEAVQVNPHLLQASPGRGRVVERRQEGLGHAFRGELVRVKHPNQPKPFKNGGPDELLHDVDSGDDERPLFKRQDLYKGIISPHRDNEVGGVHVIKELEGSTLNASARNPLAPTSSTTYVKQKALVSGWSGW